MIFTKGDVVGVLVLTITESGTLLGLNDSRAGITRSLQQSPDLGRARYESAINTCVTNGFRAFDRVRNNAETS